MLWECFCISNVFCVCVCVCVGRRVDFGVALGMHAIGRKRNETKMVVEEECVRMCMCVRVLSAVS